MNSLAIVNGFVDGFANEIQLAKNVVLAAEIPCERTSATKFR